MEWPEETMLNLVETYKLFKHLWDPKDRNYFKKEKKIDAWNEVALAVGKSTEACKKKIISLLATHRKEKNKVRSSIGTGKGTDEVYNSRWFAYEAFRFLEDRDRPRQGLNSDLESQNETTDDERSEENDSLENVVVKNIATEEVLPPTPKTSFKPPLKKKKKLSEEDNLKNKMDEAFSILRNNAQRKEKDFCDKYGEIVAERLRQFDERTRDVAINHIDNLLFQIKLNPNMATQYPLALPINQNLTIPTSAYPQNSPISSPSQASYGSYPSSSTTPFTPFESSATLEETPQSFEPVYETLGQCFKNSGSN